MSVGVAMAGLAFVPLVGDVAKAAVEPLFGAPTVAFLTKIGGGTLLAGVTDLLRQQQLSDKEFEKMSVATYQPFSNFYSGITYTVHTFHHFDYNVCNGNNPNKLSMDLYLYNGPLIQKLQQLSASLDK